MLRRLGIRGKILAVLAVPLLVLFVAAGVISAQAQDQSRRAGALQSLLLALGDSRDVVAALQAERDTTVVLADVNPSHSTINVTTNAPLVDPADAKLAAVTAARGTTDTPVSRFERDIQTVEYDLLDPTVRAAATDAQSALKSLGEYRTLADTAAAANLATIRGDYTSLIAAQIQFLDRSATLVANRDVALSLSSAAAADNVVEYLEQDKVIGLQMLRWGVANVLDLDPQQSQLTSRTFAASDIIHDVGKTRLAQLQDPALVLPDLGASVTTFQSFESARQQIGVGMAGSLRQIREIDFRRQADQEIAALSDLRRALWTRSNDQASAAANSAVRNMLGTIAATLGILGASTLIALATARLIIRPLRRLTAATAKVEEDLPRLVEQVSVPGQGPDIELTRIPVESNDEVGRLAAAFNGVNETTVRIAQEQAALRGSIAEMFVNVARRDQVLLNRQLGFLDQLERAEEDPDTLGNLFKLDHLATRMRRNAESLLVLAGIDSGRRIRGQMTLSNVIRTASSEIEHYERVQLALPIDPSMLGHNALASAHLMAELLENATVFSEPGTPVEVETAMDDLSVTVTIADHGLGMSNDELAAANEKISSVSAGDVLGTQRLGLYVVGRIAQRLNASVVLSKSQAGSGTLATITFLRTLFLAEEHREIHVPGAAAASAQTPFVPAGDIYAPQIRRDAPLEPLESFGQATATGLPTRDHAAADLPARRAAAETSVEPEPPLVKAVNLADLTDGQTELGLPRRRTRADDGSPITAVPISEADLAAGRHVLPALPSLAGWSPDGLFDSETPTPDAASRAGMFSGFRSRRGAAQAATESAEDVPFQPLMIPSSTPLVPVVEKPSEPSEPSLPVPTMSTPEPEPEPQPEPAEVDEWSAAAAATAASTSIGHHVADDTFDGAPSGVTAEPGLGFETTSGTSAQPEEPEFQGAGFGEQEPPPFVVPGLEPDDDYDVTPFEAEFGPASEATPTQGDEVAAAGADFGARNAVDDHYAPSSGAVAPEPSAFPAFDGSSFAEAAYGVDSAPEVPIQYESYPPAEAASYPSPNAYVEYPRESPVPSAEPSPAFGGSSEAAESPATALPVGPSFSEILVGAPTAPKPGIFRRVFGRRKQVPSVTPAPPALDDFSAIVRPGPVAAGARTAQPVIAAPPTPAWASDEAVKAYPAPETQPAESVSSAYPAPETQPTESAFSAYPAPETQPTESVLSAYPAPPAASAYPVAPAPAAQSAYVPPPPAPPAESLYPVYPAAWTPQAYEPPVFGSTPAPIPEPSPYAATYGADELSQRPYEPVEFPTTGPAFTPAPTGSGAMPYAPHDGDGSGARPYKPTFVPDFAPIGSMASDAARMLAERSDIAQQALSEFSQLSSYRPSTVDGGRTALKRRVPAAVPETPLIATHPAAVAAGGAVSTASEPREARDAEQVRSLLASFQSGSSRGRRAAHISPGTPSAEGAPNLGNDPSGGYSAGLDPSESASRG